MNHRTTFFLIRRLTSLLLLGLPLLTMAGHEDPEKKNDPPGKDGANAKPALALQLALNHSLHVSNQAALPALLAPAKIAVADLTPEAKAVKDLFEQLEKEGKIRTTLTNNALQELPVAIPLTNAGSGQLLLKKAVFYPDHVELEVHARLLLGDEEIYFGSKKVMYVMGSGFAGTASLAMLGNQEFSNTQYKVTLTGGSAGTAPPATVSQLKINCGNFDGLVVKGNFELNKDTYLKLDNKGYPVANGAVTSVIDFQTNNLTDLNIKLKSPLAFTLAKSQTVMGFLLTEVFFDLSQTSTPSAINAAIGSFFGTNPNVIKQWTGLYATTSRVYLPMFFIPATPSDPKPQRPSFQSNAFLLDASGMYMQAQGTNVASFNQLGGSPMTISQISFTLNKSNYSNFQVSGKIGVLTAKSPFKKNDPKYDLTSSSLKPDEYLTYSGSLDDKSEAFSLKVNQQENMFFLGAKSTLREDSKVDFTEDTPNIQNTRFNSENSAYLFPVEKEPKIQKGGGELESGVVRADTTNPNGLITGNNSLQARLVTPKLSFRYVIGLGVDGKQVSHDVSATNNDKILSLGVVLVEDLVVGYSFLSKKPIFNFTKMGYERLGNAPVFGKIGLKKLMASYDENEKQCTVNFTFYANINPVSKQAAFDKPDTTSGLNITAGVDIAFAWEVSDAETSKIDFKSSFKSISLSTLKIASGSDAGFTLDGEINYENSNEEYGRVCTGFIKAEFKIKGVSKLAKAQGTGDDSDSPKMEVRWTGGRAYAKTDTAFSFAYFDFVLSFGEAGLPAGPLKVNGFGAGVGINMTQTNELGNKYSITNKKFLPRRDTYGALFAVTLIDIPKTQRGMLGIYAEGAKGKQGSGGGFRKLQIFGTWEFARNKLGVEVVSAQSALAAATGSAAGTGAAPPAPARTSKQQINNALKLLDVSLDDKFAILKFDLTFDATSPDFVMEGNLYGFMRHNFNDRGDSYIQGAADDQGAGFLGMINVKMKFNSKATKEQAAAEDKKPSPIDGYLWIGRPEQPLAIEMQYNLSSKPESPTYLKFGATLFIVGGNIPLPSNIVKYTSVVENAKTAINNELTSRGERPIFFDMPLSVTQEGTSYFGLGVSLGGEINLTTPTKAVGAYANLALGFGVTVAYDKNFLSCNDSHWLGSGVFHGSGELGIYVNIKKTQTKFAILYGAVTAGGVFDFKGSYGAMTFEYSILGGIIDGKAFMTFGDSPCLAGNKTYEISSDVNLVKETSPLATIQRNGSDAGANATERIYRNELIVLHIDPQVAVYEYCNIVLDGGDPIENVMVAANYTGYGKLQRFINVQPNDQIRFVSTNGTTDIDDRKLYKKWSRLFNANDGLHLYIELVITDGTQSPDGGHPWVSVVADFKQKFNFYVSVNQYYTLDLAQKLPKFAISGAEWYYIRNP